MIEKITKIELEEKMTKIICSDSVSFFFQSDNKSSLFFSIHVSWIPRTGEGDNKFFLTTGKWVG